jgi:hypothetical protein
MIIELHAQNARKLPWYHTWFCYLIYGNACLCGEGQHFRESAPLLIGMIFISSELLAREHDN